jgi:hypothetical protein
MSEHPILIHDAHGFTQALRRQRLLEVCADDRTRHATFGKAMTWTEEPDGVTLYLNGVCGSRITYAERAHYEAHPEEVP